MLTQPPQPLLYGNPQNQTHPKHLACAYYTPRLRFRLGLRGGGLPTASAPLDPKLLHDALAILPAAGVLIQDRFVLRRR